MQIACRSADPVGKAEREYERVGSRRVVASFAAKASVPRCLQNRLFEKRCDGLSVEALNPRDSSRGDGAVRPNVDGDVHVPRDGRGLGNRWIAGYRDVDEREA